MPFRFRERILTYERLTAASRPPGEHTEPAEVDSGLARRFERYYETLMKGLNCISDRRIR